MKRTASIGIALAVLLLASCTDDTETDTTPTVIDEQDSDPESPTGEPEPDDGQWSEAVPFDSTVTLPATGEIPAIITWKAPGETLHVYTSGSSTSGCYTAPVDAWTDGETIEIRFDAGPPSLNCTDDLVTHAWEITWSEPFDVTGPMSMTLTDIPAPGHTFTDVMLPAGPTAPLG